MQDVDDAPSHVAMPIRQRSSWWVSSSRYIEINHYEPVAITMAATMLCLTTWLREKKNIETITRLYVNFYV